MCGSTTITLSLADLDESTTEVPVNVPGKEQVIHLNTITNAFKRGSEKYPLKEAPLYTCGSGQWPSRLRFLGKHQDMPFLMVQTGNDLFKSISAKRTGSVSSMSSVSDLTEGETSSPQTSSNFSSFTSAGGAILENEISLVPYTPKYAETNTVSKTISSNQDSSVIEMASLSVDTAHNGRSQSPPLHSQSSYREPERNKLECPSFDLSHTSRSQQTLNPKALCLTVQLSRKSFLSNPYPQAKKLATLDVKIDIFFNGELCASAYVPERFRGDATVSELTQRFGGRRIERLLECPWIFVPTKQNPHSSLGDQRQNEEAYADAHQRWTAISETLKVEAEKCGSCQQGEPSILGDYLDSLSKLPMPQDVGVLQKPGGLKFGVIDVVLTAGHGKKDEPDAGYLAEPASIRVSSLRSSKLKVTRSNPLSVERNGQNMPSKLKAKRKTFADAEIIALGFSPFRVQRQTTILGTSTGYKASDNNATFLNLVAASCAAQPPKASSTAPSATYRRRSSISQLSSPVIDVSPLQSREGNITINRNNNTPSGIDFICATDMTFHPSPALSSFSDVQQPQSAGNLNVNTSSSPFKMPKPKRHRVHIPTTPQQETSMPQTPKSSTHKHYTVPYQGRYRCSQGHFVKTPSPAKATSIAGRPQKIPQKRYKGIETQAEDESRLSQGSKRRRTTGHEIMVTHHTTLADEIAAIERGVVQQLVATPAPIDTHPGISRLLPYATRTETAARRRPTIFPWSRSSFPATMQTARTSLIRPSALASAPLKKSHVLTLCLPPAKLATLHTRLQSPAPVLRSLNYSATSLSSLTSLDADSSRSDSPDNSINDTLYLDMATTTALVKPRVIAKHKSRRVQKVEKYQVENTWKPGSIHEDCVLTYASDKVRQVKAERTGWFKEASIIVGVRFLVG
ncbi:hypothetical protein MMC19_003107 [Ptychographa xylographoides]|nr:hypothetical protein [Ptychographa xylographoides]